MPYLREIRGSADTREVDRRRQKNRLKSNWSTRVRHICNWMSDEDHLKYGGELQISKSDVNKMRIVLK